MRYERREPDCNPRQRSAPYVNGGMSTGKPTLMK